MQLKVKKLTKTAKLPVKNHATYAGLNPRTEIRVLELEKVKEKTNDEIIQGQNEL